ncbi:MAG: site-specific tyrosine recombinase [Gemmatimonadota bacterium]
MTGELEAFVEYLVLERGLAPRTIEAYRSDIERYLAFAGETGRDPGERGTVRAWLEHLHGRGLSPSTQSRRLTSLRGFFRFLVAEGRVMTDPTEAVEPPRRRRRLPDTLSIDEVDRVIDAVGGAEPFPLRDRALLEFLYATGVRISELIAVRVDDCDWRGRSVRLVPARREVRRRDGSRKTERIGPKGDKVRIVPIGSRAVEAATEYVERERPALAKGRSEGALFLNFRGRPLSRMGAWKIVRAYVDKAGIRKRVTPHTFRHTCATHLLDRGADLRVVQELLGHADITTTQVYTHVDPPYLKAEHRRHHPRA